MFRLTIAAALLATSVTAFAQAQADALGKCLADNTTGKDRKDLAKWVFVSMAVHPEIRQYANANIATAADESSRTMALLITRLLTESCTNETRALVKAGSSEAIRIAFQNLGRLAMQELMTDKTVNDSMGRFATYLDQKRFRDLMADK